MTLFSSSPSLRSRVHTESQFCAVQGCSTIGIDLSRLAIATYRVQYVAAAVPASLEQVSSYRVPCLRDRFRVQSGRTDGSPAGYGVHGRRSTPSYRSLLRISIFLKACGKTRYRNKGSGVQANGRLGGTLVEPTCRVGRKRSQIDVGWGVSWPLDDHFLYLLDHNNLLFVLRSTISIFLRSLPVGAGVVGCKRSLVFFRGARYHYHTVQKQQGVGVARIVRGGIRALSLQGQPESLVR